MAVNGTPSPSQIYGMSLAIWHGGGPWPAQNFGWVGHNAFGPINNWPVSSLILHCGQLILRKISKIGASRYQILRLKCTKFTFCWDSAPDPAGRAYIAPRPLPLFKGPTSKGMEGNGRGGIKGKLVKGKEGERWREGFGPPKNFGVAPPMPYGITQCYLPSDTNEHTPP